ncbi:MAG TPA: serine acetyltransferase, partial [Burkholderiaceae bacterium]|nr:serine acetyltransferase [Burkholderiaceae bacterium]
MAVFDINPIVSELNAARQDWRSSQQRSREPGGREFPSPVAISDILNDLKGILFPMRLGPLDLRQESEDFYIGHTLDSALHALLGQVRLELRYQLRHAFHDEAEIEERAVAAVQAFAYALPGI